MSVKKKKINVKSVLSEFNILFKRINKSLIEKTGLYANEVQKLYDKGYPTVVKFLASENISDSPLAVKGAEKKLMDNCVLIVVDRHRVELSPFEVNEVTSILSRISDQYDLDDARVYVLVKSLVSHILSSVRLQIECMSSDTLFFSFNNQTVTTSCYINPAEKVKLEFDRSIVNAIESLSKIIDGEKVELSFKAIPFNELFGKPIKQADVVKKSIKKLK